jgi:intracellular sulfur oxidation DsrE/DsrF family protein
MPIRRWVVLSMLVLLSRAALAQAPSVVYHFVDGPEQASRGLEYIRNHLEADPKAQIVVVTHAAGVDFLMTGAKTAKGNAFRGAVEDLELAGVKFRVCEITLRERGLRREQFVGRRASCPRASRRLPASKAPATAISGRDDQREAPAEAVPVSGVRTICTRRLSWRPAAVSFVATGIASP